MNKKYQTIEEVREADRLRSKLWRQNNPEKFKKTQKEYLERKKLKESK